MRFAISTIAMNAVRATLCAGLLASQAAPASAALVSTFDTGEEGWSVGSSQGSDGVDGFGWSATGGRPDGHVSARDIGSEGGWWFIAPTAWSGDWSAYLGGTLSFDVFAEAGRSTEPNPPVTAAVLSLVGGGSLRAKATAMPVVPGDWRSVTLSLTPDAFDLVDTAYERFEEALSKVERLIIPADFVFSQVDVTRLDNVRVQAIPLPSTGALALLALALLGHRSRQRERCYMTRSRVWTQWSNPTGPWTPTLWTPAAGRATDLPMSSCRSRDSKKWTIPPCRDTQRDFELRGATLLRNAGRSHPACGGLH